MDQKILINGKVNWWVTNLHYCIGSSLWICLEVEPWFSVTWVNLVCSVME